MKTWWIVSLVALALPLGGAVALVRDPKAEPASWASPNTARVEAVDLERAVREAEVPRVGGTVPNLDVKDEVGARFYLAGHLELGPVLLGVLCPCAECERAAAAWNRLWLEHPRQFHVAAILTGADPAAALRFTDRLHLQYPLLPDPNRALSARFRGPGDVTEALRTPRAVVIGRDGRYRYVMPARAVPSPEVRRALGI